MNPDKSTSLRKLASCRANGALSSGPVTAEGKARSARNSLKHGLAAAAIVLAGEDSARYECLRARNHAQFQPRTLFEAALVDNLVAAQWRQYRAICMESAAFDLETDNQRADVHREYEEVSADVRAVLALRGDLHGDRAIVTCSRYSLRFERQWNRTLDQLLALLGKPPVGPTLDELEPELEQADQPAPETAPPIAQNEPNPISGHAPGTVRFKRTIRVLSAAATHPLPLRHSPPVPGAAPAHLATGRCPLPPCGLNA